MAQRTRTRGQITPMGQGLAVVATLIGMTIVSAGAIMGYLLSLHIASWSARDRALDRQIREGREQVQQLQMELTLRSRFPQLARWSGTLGLRPAEGQQYAPALSDIHAAASQRELALAGKGCGAAPPFVSACPDQPPAGGARGYTPRAREQMDSLIGAILH